MEGMRSLIGHQLGRSLGALPELARLEAAWPVACGQPMADRGVITGFEAGELTVEVEDEFWMAEMLTRRAVLERELSRIAAVPVRRLHLKGRRR